MKPLKYLFHPTTLCRMRTYIFSSHYRYLSMNNNNTNGSVKTKTNETITPQPEIGPEAPEIQINNLTGEHQSIEECLLFLLLKLKFF